MEQIFSKVTVDNVTPGLKGDKGIFQAQLRQTVTKRYPSARPNNSNTLGALFSNNEFEIEAQEYESIRVTWIGVPAGTTEEEVQKRIDALKNPRIYTVISHDVKDVMTDEQRAAILAGLTTEKAIAERTMVRDNSGAVVQPIQYKANFFATEAVEDVDRRPETRHMVDTADTAVTNEQVMTIGA